jgi:hypothetical protein
MSFFVEIEISQRERPGRYIQRPATQSQNRIKACNTKNPSPSYLAILLLQQANEAR